MSPAICRTSSLDLLNHSLLILKSYLQTKNNTNKSGVRYMATITISALENMTLKELYNLAKEYKLTNYSKLTKKELIFAILKTRAEQEGFFFMEGVLEIIQSEGFGFLRPINYSPSSQDIYISASQIRRFDLRNADKVSGKEIGRASCRERV